MGQCLGKDKHEVRVSSEEYKTRGNEFFSKGNYQQAAEQYKSAIKINKNVSIYHSNLANCYYRLKNYKESYKSASTASELDPHNFKALVYQIRSSACLALEGDSLYFNISLKLCNKSTDSKLSPDSKHQLSLLSTKIQNIFSQVQKNEKKKSLLSYYSIHLPPDKHQSLKSFLEPKEFNLPSLTCPLTLVNFIQEVFDDPETLESGNTYEAKLLIDLEKSPHPVDPLTRKSINTRRRYKNNALKSAVQWFSHHFPDQVFKQDRDSYEI
jgi:tetratricopeptide (TPR) repeat protein